MNFCFENADDGADRMSSKVLNNLETIDDDTDRKKIVLVKTDELEEARARFGKDLIGEVVPILIKFADNRDPEKYNGDLTDEALVLDWLLENKPVARSLKVPPEPAKKVEKKAKIPPPKPKTAPKPVTPPKPQPAPKPSKAPPAKKEPQKVETVDDTQDEAEDGNKVNDEFVETVAENSNVVVFFCNFLNEISFGFFGSYEVKFCRRENGQSGDENRDWVAQSGRESFSEQADCVLER